MLIDGGLLRVEVGARHKRKACSRPGWPVATRVGIKAELFVK